MSEKKIIYLTKDNWYDWVESIEEFAMCLPHNVKEIITTKTDVTMATPIEPTAPRGTVSDAQASIYRTQMMSYESKVKKCEAIQTARGKLLSQILGTLSDEVKAGLDTNLGYAALKQTGNVLEVFKLVETVTKGSGNASTHATIKRLLQLKQKKGQYKNYHQEFFRLERELVRQGTAQELLDKILDSLFILGTDQVEFKDRLTAIYGSKNWPGRQTTSQEFKTFAEQTAMLSNLQKDEEEAEEQAKVEAMRTGLTCYNCDGVGHTSSQCTRKRALCRECGRYGHMTKHHDDVIEARDRRRCDTESDEEEEEPRKRGDKKWKRNAKSDRTRKYKALAALVKRPELQDQLLDFLDDDDPYIEEDDHTQPWG